MTFSWFKMYFIITSHYLLFFFRQKASIMNADIIPMQSDRTDYISDNQTQHIKAEIQHNKVLKKKCKCYQYSLYNNWYMCLCKHCRIYILLKELPEYKEKILDTSFAYSIPNINKWEEDFLTDEHRRKLNWSMIIKLQMRKSDILQNLMLKCDLTRTVIDIKMFHMMYEQWKIINNGHQHWEMINNEEQFEIMTDGNMDQPLPCEREDARKSMQMVDKYLQDLPCEREDAQMVEKYLQDLRVLQTNIVKICKKNNPSSLLKISAFKLTNLKGFNWEKYISYIPYLKGKYIYPMYQPHPIFNEE